MGLSGYGMKVRWAVASRPSGAGFTRRELIEREWSSMMANASSGPTTIGRFVDRTGVGRVSDVYFWREIGVTTNAGWFDETGVAHGHRAPERLDLGIAAAEDEPGVAMINADEILAVLDEAARPAWGAIGGETDEPRVFARDQGIVAHSKTRFL